MVDRLRDLDRIYVPDPLREQVHADVELRCVRAFDGGEPLSNPDTLVSLYIDQHTLEGGYQGDLEIRKISMQEVAQDVQERMRKLRDFIAETSAFNVATSELIFHCHDEAGRIWEIRYSFDKLSWSLKKEFRLRHDRSVHASEAPTFDILLVHNPVTKKDTLKFSARTHLSITDLPTNPTPRARPQINVSPSLEISRATAQFRANILRFWRGVFSLFHDDQSQHSKDGPHGPDPRG